MRSTISEVEHTVTHMDSIEPNPSYPRWRTCLWGTGGNTTGAYTQGERRHCIRLAGVDIKMYSAGSLSLDTMRGVAKVAYSSDSRCDASHRGLTPGTRITASRSPQSTNSNKLTIIIIIENLQRPVLPEVVTSDTSQ
jgi:hypothetical protein